MGVGHISHSDFDLKTVVLSQIAKPRFHSFLSVTEYQYIFLTDTCYNTVYNGAMELVMDIDDFIKRFKYESDEARIDNLFKSIRIYLNEIQDVNSRIAAVHLLIRKLRDLLNEYPK